MVDNGITWDDIANSLIDCVLERHKKSHLAKTARGKEIQKSMRNGLSKRIFKKSRRLDK